METEQDPYLCSGFAAQHIFEMTKPRLATVGKKWSKPNIRRRVGKTKSIYFVKDNFTICNVPNISRPDERTYAFFYSGDYKTITGKTMKSGGNVRRYICIANNGEKVYKQYYSLNGISKGQIALDYESICNLGVDVGDCVTVYSINKLCYYWHTSDSVAKLSLLLAIFSIVLSIVMYIIF